jgi:hypothetical protein
MTQIIATIFLALVIAGIAKMIYDVQMSKLKNMLTHLLK